MRKIVLLWFLALGIVLSPLGMVKAQYGAGAPPQTPLMCGPTGCAVVGGGAPMAAGNVTGACSTGGTQTFSPGSNMTAFRLTCGTTAATSISVGWPVTRNNIPFCSITGETAAPIIITTNSTITLAWSLASTASTVWDVVCYGQ